MVHLVFFLFQSTEETVLTITRGVNIFRLQILINRRVEREVVKGRQSQRRLSNDKVYISLYQ